MKEPDQHSSPIKSPRQLVIVVVLAFAVPVLLIVLISQLITGGRQGASVDDSRIMNNVQAIGAVILADASAPTGNLSGEAVYGQACKTCHEAGLAGAPKFGDKAAWTPRLGQGQATVVRHAIAGYQGKSGAMPARGGNPDLTDAEVERAVVYMANQIGAGWTEPPATAPAAVAGAPAAPAAAPAPAATPAAMPVAAAPPGAAPATAASAADGKKAFETACVACHGAGIAGAPKFGDKAAWAPRIATGVNTLYTHALIGFQGKAGVMPAKGGNAALSDAEVKAAVDYMVAAAK